MIKKLFHFLMILFFICCSNITKAQQMTATTGNTYALVIGIAKYLDPEIPQLQFSNRDAKIFADFLQSKAGGSVPKENIRLLMDSTASTGAVYNAIYWLKNICKKGDKVYIYFSGHGDLENITMYNNGFLICFDSPQFNYVGLALSIDYLNDIANTLSVKTEANVILITDACHSGKLTEKKFKGNFLAAEQLRKVKNKEIRITSSAANELSNENADWGGGRGVFSYYLVNGLKGLAAKSNSDKITLDDIRNYLDSSLKNDLVLMQDSTKQTPFVKGNGSFVLSQVDTKALIVAKKEITADTLVQRALIVGSSFTQESPESLFYRLLSQQSLEGLTDSLQLYKLPANKVLFAIIDSLKKSEHNEYTKSKLNELYQTLASDGAVLEQYNNTLATAFDEAGQRVITQYLKGDAAELARRRYYNAAYSNYDVYPRMFQIALNLTSPDNSYYANNLQVKLHYFSGVAARLKLPLTEPSKQKTLIEYALSEQKKALSLEMYAPYIYNELGILYTYKKNDAAAEKYFKIAALRSPNWALPRSNLADLYTEKGQLEKALAFADSAKKLQPDYDDIHITYGMIHEKQGQFLHAEESYQKNIKLNKGSFIPFERLGYVYISNLQFSIADSMLFAAAKRKKGFYFDGWANPRFVKLPKTVPIDGLTCNIDSSTIGAKDIIGQFGLGYTAYRDYDLAKAERAFKRVIDLDKNNPLAFHYLGMVLADEKRWQEAELILKLAISNHLPDTAWQKHSGSFLERSVMSTEFINDYCADDCYQAAYYDIEEDYFLLARVYEDSKRYSESETYYRKYIAAKHRDEKGYTCLSRVFIKNGKFYDAEILLNEYHAFTGKGLRMLDEFYKKVTDSLADNGEWNLKAGIFQYTIAIKNPYKYNYDTKKTDELTGEFFYREAYKGLIKYPAPVLPRLIPYGTIIPPTEISRYSRPFTNGIYYLKNALANTQYDEVLLTDINTKIGDLYTWQGLPDSAIYFYEAALKFQPDNADIHFKLIDLYSASYRFEDALVSLDTLQKNDNLSFNNQLLLAKFLMQDGRFDEAKKLLNDVEKIIPYTNTALTNLKGKLEVMRKNYEQGLEIYQTLYQLNKQDSIVLYNFARTYSLSGNKPQAWKWLNLALKSGFNYTYVLQNDPAMKLLQKDRRWETLIKGIKGVDYPNMNM